MTGGIFSAIRSKSELIASDAMVIVGKADAMLVRPKNPSEPTLILMDADHNGVAERTLWDENGDAQFEFITYDTDQDGTDDLVGTDLDNNLKPRVVKPIS